MSIMKFKKGTIIIVLLVSSIGIMSMQQPKPWPVPDNAAKVKNPVKSNAESVAAGKTLWQQNCASCHGKTGKGDGSKAAQLKTPMVDFSTAEFQSMTDGGIFYKTSEGRGDMPAFKKKIPEAMDIWDIVNYTRTFKK
jgi:mono/diheme cytochrome c family protein